MCDVSYLCANFSLPRPLCSRVRPDVRDRQTSDRWYGMAWYGIVEFNVPLDTVYVILETEGGGG